MAERQGTPVTSPVESKDSDKSKDEDSGSESEEQEVEPKLKYERIMNDLSSILSKDAASCLAVHPKFLAFGSHWGMIHILDHIGNNISSKQLPAHTTTVNQISIDDNGDYIASCSDDGRIVINGLYSMDNNQTINFDRPIKAVALDPNFYKSGSGKHFVTGDEKLVLNEKGFLGRYKTYVLHQGEGPIRNIAWKGNFIAWANDIGVKVYDMSSRRRITFIAKENPNLRPELYRCSLSWKDEKTLLIGWGTSVKVCVIRERYQEEARDLPNRYVEIVSMFSMEYMICGVAPHGDHLVILCYDEEALQQQEAMALAAEHGKELKRHTYQDIGRLYLDHLLQQEEYDSAGQLCVKILGSQKELWEEQAWRFTQIKQLKALAPYLPLGEPTLSPELYEMVLNDFLFTDQSGFRNLIKDWPSDLYHIQAIINAVHDRLDKERNNPILLECLGDLYTYDKRYDKALYIYVKLQKREVFQLICDHNLFSSIADNIVLLMEFDSESTVKMVLDNISQVPVPSVVKQLEHRPALLHLYLDRLYHKDPSLGREYQHLQVSLYAEYDRPKLLPFLRLSTDYGLQGALEECQQRSLIPEMVFLLGRMGNTKQALQLIVNELRDVSQAIDFCKEHNDEELWEDLIDYAINKPSFITGLLHNIGTHVDPILLIQRIREGMEIPGLRDSLVKILHDYNLQTSLREGCRKILVKDCFSLSEKLVKMQRRGICVEETQVCQACHQRILVTDLRFATNVLVFHCHHVFHEDCIPAHNRECCMICSSQKRSPGGIASPRK